MSDIDEAASAEAQDARNAEVARQAAEDEAARLDARPAAPSGILAAIEAWFAKWYPETAAAEHPAAPFSAARLHAQHAFEDLRARLGGV